MVGGFCDSFGNPNEQGHRVSMLSKNHLAAPSVATSTWEKRSVLAQAIRELRRAAELSEGKALPIAGRGPMRMHSNCPGEHVYLNR